MTSKEASSIFTIGAIMGLRMLGLFMILPIFTLYGQTFPDSTPTLLGLALGIYGLTQAILQIPFGALSDIFGRRKLIVIGLCLFSIGSLIAALSTTLTQVIIGRALQGAGAIGSPCLAYLADVTRPEVRARSMALLGAIIGFFFIFAIGMGPLVAQWTGSLTNIFWITFGLALLGIVLAQSALSSSPLFSKSFTLKYKDLIAILTKPNLRPLNNAVVVTHAIFTACFIPIPLLLTPLVGQTQLSFYYLLLIIGSFISILPLIIFAEKYNCSNKIVYGALFSLSISPIFLFFHWLPGLLLTLFLFFGAFNLLEALLPALVSRRATTDGKGITMGIYTTHQFLGIFLGGTLGGWLYTHYQLEGIVVLASALGALWWLIEWI